MSDTDTLGIVVNMRGGREAAAQADAVAKALGGIGTAAGSVTVNMREASASSDRTSNSFLHAITTTLRYAAAFTALSAAGAVISSGFKFDATMEQDTVAFTHFLGSAAAARKELALLYDIAAKTPFSFQDVTSATRKFLAFGFSVTDANKELGILGDAVAGIGGGSEEINRLILAIGQIRAKGRLQGEELLQLTELGLISTQQIAAQMNMTGAEFLKQVQRGKVGSEDAIRAINNVLTEQFKGSADEQSKTLIGQLSTAKDYGAQAAGALVQPLVDFVKSNVMPKIIADFQKASEYLKAGGAQDIYHYLGLTLKILTPLIALLVVYKGAVLAVTAAEALWAGANVAVALWGTLAAVVALIPAVTSLADAWVLLDAATYGNPFVALIVGIIALGVALVVLYKKWGFFHDLVNSTVHIIASYFEAQWHIFQRVLDIIQKVAGALATIGGGAAHVIGSALKFTGFHATGGTIPVGGFGVVGDAGPEIATNTGAGTVITPMGGGAGASSPRVLQPIQFHLDGRVFAEAMVNVGATAAARA